MLNASNLKDLIHGHVLAGEIDSRRSDRLFTRLAGELCGLSRHDQAGRLATFLGGSEGQYHRVPGERPGSAVVRALAVHKWELLPAGPSLLLPELTSLSGRPAAALARETCRAVDRCPWLAIPAPPDLAFLRVRAAYLEGHAARFNYSPEDGRSLCRSLADRWGLLPPDEVARRLYEELQLPLQDRHRRPPGAAQCRVETDPTLPLVESIWGILSADEHLGPGEARRLLPQLRAEYARERLADVPHLLRRDLQRLDGHPRRPLEPAVASAPTTPTQTTPRPIPAPAPAA